MSELTDRLHRRTARLAFGSALVVGVLALISQVPQYLRHEASIPAGAIVTSTWLVAGLAYLAAYWAPVPRSIERLRMPSLVIPAIGVVSLLPITFHMPIVLALADSRGFDFWVGMSVFMAAAAQFAIGAFAVERIRAAVVGRTPRRLRSVYLFTVLAGCIPSLLAGAILVAITALPILGILRELERIAATERQPDFSLPTATARTL